ncbi:hypothetical protein WA026_005788 [Henosepilachna vigintioctopunctata]|uniref:BZIP domain-containing protein n=1 Tax=Henosepilachna vigintioctopunctata TaxID=420089 RepID=A0AAW1U2W4_9CUCU
MDLSGSTHHFGDVSGSAILPVSAFSAYNLLKNCNYLLNKPPDFQQKILSSQDVSTNCTLSPLISDEIVPNMCINQDKREVGPLPMPFLASSSFYNYPQNIHILQKDEICNRGISSTCSGLFNTMRRQRGEKKPIPDDMKDEKYFERRKRNNQAAKKSRDARKMREDQVVLRASILEHENAILRAQVLTLREESSSLRRLLLQKKALEIVSMDTVRFANHKMV